MGRPKARGKLTEKPKGRKITKRKCEHAEGVKIMHRMVRRTIALLSNKVQDLEDRVHRTPSATTECPTSSEVGFHNDTTTRVIYSIQPPSKKPKFSGKMHPVAFVEKLSAYVRKFECEGKSVIADITEYLDGESRDWARVFRHRWLGLEDFKRDFLETYWGETEQNLLRQRLVGDKWNKEEHPTMLGHFLSLTSQAQMLPYPVPEQQLVSDIMRHNLKKVQYVWSLNKANTMMEAIDLLRRLDNVAKQDRTVVNTCSQVTGVKSRKEKRKSKVQEVNVVDIEAGKEDEQSLN